MSVSKHVAGSRNPGRPPVLENGAGLGWLRRIVIAGALLVPLAISPDGLDAFRYPKELALRFEAILLTTLVVSLAILGRPVMPRRASDRSWLLLVAAVAGWAAVSAAMA